MPREFGYVATSATTEVAINATTYNEPSTATGFSVKSSSANDTAAGTGAHTVKIKYYVLDANSNITGPFYYTVTLNGVTAVQIDATSLIRLFDCAQVLTVGSGGKSAGIISFYPSTDGTGTATASIAAGDFRTYLGHAYVPNGSRLNVIDIVAASGEASTVQTQFNLRALSYPSANVQERVLTAALAAQGLSGSKQLNPMGQPLAVIPGPARLQLYVTPGASAGTTQRAEFGFYYA
jgi:hypothetical protein